MKTFNELSEREILALAISQEEEDGKIYGEFAERMRPTHPKTADALAAMRDEESSHRHPPHSPAGRTRLRKSKTYLDESGSHG